MVFSPCHGIAAMGLELQFCSDIWNVNAPTAWKRKNFILFTGWTSKNVTPKPVIIGRQPQELLMLGVLSDLHIKAGMCQAPGGGRELGSQTLLMSGVKREGRELRIPEAWCRACLMKSQTSLEAGAFSSLVYF